MKPFLKNLFCLLPLKIAWPIALFAQNKSIPVIINARSINSTSAEILYSNHHRLLLDFYGENIVRLFQDNNGGFLRAPEAKPEAHILVKQPRKQVSQIQINNQATSLSVSSAKISLQFNKQTGLLKIINLTTQQIITETIAPIAFEKNSVSLFLKAQSDEYFYGGGVQNGRFSHKGKIISIENQNSWTDGGVASPTPFYWSNKGYGIMWYTFKQGKYDFGATQAHKVTISHQTNYLDLFLMVDNGPAALLNNFYQLTGKPVLLPKYAFYQGHLNAYNRDYWKEDPKGILFEDGKHYSESQKNNGGIKESLNGEKNNYQFSARAVIDRYQKADMPLGWILPNDGYGAGYGQTSTLDSNIANLKSFGNYARKNGVEIGLWTQSDLHPKDSISALLQRDILKEVRDAGVRVLKTDVAWVGDGYSFGLNGVADVAHIMPHYGNNARPFIISLDGWAGTQRYASIWTGDQTGGLWEYIRFHIPTYIGSGLSGQPNISSDMDGIFGGENKIVNIRDFQWKTFTPTQLNMDGWGSNPKYPQALGEPATSINRNYLKLKSILLPYTYSIAQKATDSLPIIRAMFLEQANHYTLGTATQYQFMYGPSFLIAPIYKNTRADTLGNDLRNNIYLPKGTWFDYFTGDKYEGGSVYNSFDAPIWKLPVFVKSGAIIPFTNANNHVAEIDKSKRQFEIYANTNSSFLAYDDDGETENYLQNTGLFTPIYVTNNQKQTVHITIKPSSGTFNGLEKLQSTTLLLNVSQKPTKITAKVGNKKIQLSQVQTIDAFENAENAIYYNSAPNFNQFSTKGSEMEKVKMLKNPQVCIKLSKTDITQNQIEVFINGFVFEPADKKLLKTGQLPTPLAAVKPKEITAYTLQPSWKPIANADFYEIMFDSLKYTTIADTSFIFSNLNPQTNYQFKIRAVNKTGGSAWTSINATTKANPLQFALKNIQAFGSAKDQEGEEINKLVDFDENTNWHTNWDKKAVPFNITLDLKAIIQLDKINYLPRSNGTNGILIHGEIAYSSNQKNWHEAGSFSWKNNNEVKTFVFNNHPTAKYLKISVNQASGNFGSGRELYVFKVPGSTTYLPGDINNDQKIDKNDLTSYMNYTGLRKGDSDFEGYISKGDINQNQLIDAYDIANVTTQLEGGVNPQKDAPITGKLSLISSKTTFKTGDTLSITVKGQLLASVNAFSFAMPYRAADVEYIGIEPLNLLEMSNLSYDRLHSNGEKVLYPTFVNTGNKPRLNGSNNLFIIKFKVKRSLNFIPTLEKGLLVDKDLNSISF